MQPVIYCVVALSQTPAGDEKEECHVSNGRSIRCALHMRGYSGKLLQSIRSSQGSTDFQAKLAWSSRHSSRRVRHFSLVKVRSSDVVWFGSCLASWKSELILEAINRTASASRTELLHDGSNLSS